MSIATYQSLRDQAVQYLLKRKVQEFKSALISTLAPEATYENPLAKLSPEDEAFINKRAAAYEAELPSRIATHIDTKMYTLMKSWVDELK